MKITSLIVASLVMFRSPLLGAVAPGNVVWDSPSVAAKDSMPIGNGDIGACVWVELKLKYNQRLSKPKIIQ